MEECHESEFRAVSRSDRSQNYHRTGTAAMAGEGDFLRTSSSNMIISLPVSMATARAIERPLKRKHGIPPCKPSYVENCLVQLCREERWADIVHRCSSHPEEACLIPIHSEDSLRKESMVYRHSMKQASIALGDNTNPVSSLFRETALGIACASKNIASVEAKQAIVALVHANPYQVVASQYIPGHSPLREAILNDQCTVDIFRILGEATSRCRNEDTAVFQKDRNRLSLLDHLLTSVQLGSSSNSVAMLKEFLRIKQQCFSNAPFPKDHVSPLIRLLTLGNAFHMSPASKNIDGISWDNGREPDKDVQRLQRVLEATNLLLDDDPILLTLRSKITNCTPLHVALRNYGSFAPLIQELLERDSRCETLQARNSYGDLPIHVACSVGVPSEVLRAVIKKTALIADDNPESYIPGNQSATNCETNSLLWSTNNLGYTTVDMEVICHIEGGQGLYTSRQFYRSERKPNIKSKKYYMELLKQSVDMVMDGHDSALEGVNMTKCLAKTRKQEAEAIFVGLLDRISMLIRGATATATTSFDAKENIFAQLIDCCKLASPYSPSLPLPILNLFLWLRPEEVTETVSKDFLPIHHALRCDTTLTYSPKSSMSSSTIRDWKSFVLRLLKTSSQHCKVKSREGRLPLHYALDYHYSATTPSDNDYMTTKNLVPEMKSSRHAIVKKLVDLYPESVDQKDPITGLYPFVMASKDETLPLDTIYCLLRRSPSCCNSGISKTYTKKIPP